MLSGTNGLLLRGTVLMQRAGDQFLAGAALALNQHGAVGRRDELERVDDLLHLRGGADYPLKAEFFVEPAIELGIAADEPDARGGLLHGRPQLVDVERLGKVSVGPVLHGGDGRVDRAVPGDDDHFGVGQLLLALAKDLEAVDFVHLHVGDDDVEIVLALDQGNAARARGCDRAIAVDPLETFGDGLGVGLVVVDDQHAERNAGKVARIAALGVIGFARVNFRGVDFRGLDGGRVRFFWGSHD